MHGSLRGDSRASADLPLRLLVGIALSSIVLGVSFGAADSLRGQHASDYARAALEDLRAAVAQAHARPGSVVAVRFDPPNDEAPWRIIVLAGGPGPSRASIERGSAVLAAGVVCVDCPVVVDDGHEGQLRVHAPALLSIRGEPDGRVAIGVVSG